MGIKHYKQMTYSCSAICGTGLVRGENQDNLYINGAYRQDVSDNSEFRHEDSVTGRGMYAVADGMGGEKHGELASLAAVETLGEATATAEGISCFLTEKNSHICNLIKEKGGSRIGSTFAGLCVDGEKADIINIGDSRVYLYRGGALKQISSDHTQAQRMVDLGLMDKATADRRPDKHKLTQHLGVFPEEFVIEPYSAQIEAQPGDVFLLCSDGLTDMLDDMEIKNTLDSQGNAKFLAESLYAGALGKGARDNITVAVIMAASDASKRLKSKRASGKKARTKITMSTAVIAVVTAVAVLAALATVGYLILGSSNVQTEGPPDNPITEDPLQAPPASPPAQLDIYCFGCGGSSTFAPQKMHSLRRRGEC